MLKSRSEYLNKKPLVPTTFNSFFPADNPLRNEAVLHSMMNNKKSPKPMRTLPLDYMNSPKDQPFLSIKQIPIPSFVPLTTTNAAVKRKPMDSPSSTFLKSSSTQNNLQLRAQTSHFLRREVKAPAPNKSLERNSTNKNLNKTGNINGEENQVFKNMVSTEVIELPKISENEIQNHTRNGLTSADTAKRAGTADNKFMRLRLQLTNLDDNLSKASKEKEESKHNTLMDTSKELECITLDNDDTDDGNTTKQEIIAELRKTDIIKANQSRIEEIIQYSKRNKDVMAHLVNMSPVTGRPASTKNSSSLQANKFHFLNKEEIQPLYYKSRPLTSVVTRRKTPHDKRNDLTDGTILNKTLPNLKKLNITKSTVKLGDDMNNTKSTNNILEIKTPTTAIPTFERRQSRSGSRRGTMSPERSGSPTSPTRKSKLMTSSPLKAEQGFNEAFFQKLEYIRSAYDEFCIDDEPQRPQSGVLPVQRFKNELHVVMGNLEGEEHLPKKVLEFPDDEFKDLQDNIDKLNRKFESTVKNDIIFKKQVNNDEFLKVDPNKITEAEMTIIKEEYRKKAEGLEVDYDKVDNILIRLKFFSKYSKLVRHSLLKNAQYGHYPHKAVVFKQGDYGDLMYVIIRGSVNVRAKMPNPAGNIENMLVAVIYSGGAFGELSMLGTAKKSKEATMSKVALVEQLAKRKTYQEIKEELAKLDESKSGNNISKISYANNTTLQSPKDVIDTTRGEDDKSIKKEYKEGAARAATIEVGESMDCLCIPRENFKNILVALIQKELDQKVKVLMCLPFFEKLEPLQLLPLANDLVSQTYNMGDVILQRGEMPTFLGIVARGRCKIILEITAKRIAMPTPFMKGGEGALRNFSFATNNKLGQIPRAANQNMTDLKIRKQNPYVTKTRTFEFDPVAVNHMEKSVVYKEHVPVDCLTRGDFFGIRAILSEIPNESTHTHEQINNFKAKLTIVADTSTVEIYTIERKQIQYIPEALQKQFREGLMEFPDFDDCNDGQIRGDVLDWNKSKQEEAYTALLETYTLRLKEQKRSDYKKF